MRQVLASVRQQLDPASIRGDGIRCPLESIPPRFTPGPGGAEWPLPAAQPPVAAHRPHIQHPDGTWLKAISADLQACKWRLLPLYGPKTSGAHSALSTPLISIPSILTARAVAATSRLLPRIAAVSHLSKKPSPPLSLRSTALASDVVTLFTFTVSELPLHGYLAIRPNRPQRQPAHRPGSDGSPLP